MVDGRAVRHTYLEIEHSRSSGFGDVFAVGDLEEGVELDYTHRVSVWAPNDQSMQLYVERMQARQDNPMAKT